MPSPFLDADALFELTGYRHPAKQAEILRRERIRFTLNKDGEPRVLWATLQGLETPPPQEEPPINWDAVR